MRTELERWVDLALLRSPLQPLFGRFNTPRLVVLAYHEVGDVGTFEEQIAFLAARMRPVSLEHVLRAVSAGTRLPARAVLVTFDDGHRSVLEEGLPILKRYDVPAVVFAVAGLIGTMRPFWWEEVAELIRRGGRVAPTITEDPANSVRALKTLPDELRLDSIDRLRASLGGATVETRQLTAEEIRTLVENGVAVGNHSLTHPCLDRCSDTRLSTEVCAAHEILAGILGHPPQAFAYPNGNLDARAVPILTRLGYEAAFVFDHRIGRFPPADRFAISRVRVNSADSLERFRIIVSGLHPGIHAAIGRT